MKIVSGQQKAIRLSTGSCARPRRTVRYRGALGRVGRGCRAWPVIARGRSWHHMWREAVAADDDRWDSVDVGVGIVAGRGVGPG